MHMHRNTSARMDLILSPWSMVNFSRMCEKMEVATYYLYMARVPFPAQVMNKSLNRQKMARFRVVSAKRE